MSLFDSFQIYIFRHSIEVISRLNHSRPTVHCRVFEYVHVLHEPLQLLLTFILVVITMTLFTIAEIAIHPTAFDMSFVATNINE